MNNGPYICISKRYEKSPFSILVYHILYLSKRKTNHWWQYRSLRQLVLSRETLCQWFLEGLETIAMIDNGSVDRLDEVIAKHVVVVVDGGSGAGVGVERHCEVDGWLGWLLC